MKAQVNFVLPALLFIPLLSSFSQAKENIKMQLDQAIEKWYSSAGPEQNQVFKDLVTDDFELLAFGMRFNKNETAEMMKDYSDVKYKLSNVKFSADGNLTFMTFDVEMDCKWKGNSTSGIAIELYVFKEEGDQWKIKTKVIVMVEKKVKRSL